MDANAEGERRATSSCWKGWLTLAACFNNAVRRFFYKYGHAVSSYPIIVITLCIVFTGALGWGLTWIEVESRTEKLYVPQNSRAEIDLNNGGKFFTVQTRIAKIIMERTDRGNVLTSDTFKLGNDVMKSIVNNTNMEKVCIKSNGRPWPYIRNETSNCIRVDPFQIFNYSSQAMETNISQEINRLLVNPNYLMLNGRPLSSNIENIFGSMKMGSYGDLEYAEALRIDFPIIFPKNDDVYSEVLKWEGDFLKHMDSIKNHFKKMGLNLFVFTFRSIDDSINDSTGGDVKYISITFAIMCTFTCLALIRFKSCDFVSGHSMAGTVGILVVAMGIVSGFGLVIICGTKFTSTVGILPFLILGVAIDDMFIILHELDRRNFNLPPQKIIAEVLEEVGGTVTMTTLTDLVAFAVSTTSAFPAVKYFCTFAAVGLTFSFLMIMTIFVAFLVFDIKRIKNGRMDMIPLIAVKNYKIDEHDGLIVKPTDSMSNKIMKKLGEIVTNMYGSLFVILMSIGLVTAGIIGALNVSQTFTLQMLGKDGSDYIQYLDKEAFYFKNTAVISLVVPGDFQLNNKANQEEYEKLVDIATKDNSLMLNKSINWFYDFRTWSEKNGKDITGDEFMKSLLLFLSIPKFRQYSNDIRFARNMTEIEASRVVVFMEVPTDSNRGKDSMLKLWDSIDTKSTIKPHVAAVQFLYFEQYVLIVPETTRNIIICGITVLIMTSPFLLHPGILILMVLSFAALIVELIGLMTIWNVSLNSISMIVLTMAIGFCVDYSAHVAHAYVTSGKQDSKQGISFALVTIGASVFMGGLSTFLGMLVTGFSSSEIFRIFFKMFFGIVSLGLLHGLIIIPTFLSILKISTVSNEQMQEQQGENGHVVMNRVNAENNMVVENA